MGAVRLLLADDNSVVLEMIAELLQPEFAVVAALSSGKDVLEQWRPAKPDIMVLDISLGDMTGFDVARRLQRAGCKAKIIFLTVHESTQFVRAAFDLEAAGYVFKSRIDPDLTEAIRSVSAGKRFSSAA